MMNAYMPSFFSALLDQHPQCWYFRPVPPCAFEKTPKSVFHPFGVSLNKQRFTKEPYALLLDMVAHSNSWMSVGIWIWNKWEAKTKYLKTKEWIFMWYVWTLSVYKPLSTCLLSAECWTELWLWSKEQGMQSRKKIARSLIGGRHLTEYIISG